MICRDVQIKSNPSEKGNFYFAHKEILIPFLTKLGLYRDQQPLTSDDYATRGGSRLWRTSLMSPFGANFIAVMYKYAIIILYYLQLSVFILKGAE